MQVLDGPNCSDTIDVLPSTFFLSVAKAQSDAAHGCLTCSMQMTNFGSPTVASYYFYVALHSQCMLEAVSAEKGMRQSAVEIVDRPSLMRKRLRILGSRYDWLVPLPEIPEIVKIFRQMIGLMSHSSYQLSKLQRPFRQKCRVARSGILLAALLDFVPNTLEGRSSCDQSNPKLPPCVRPLSRMQVTVLAVA